MADDENAPVRTRKGKKKQKNTPFSAFLSACEGAGYHWDASQKIFTYDDTPPADIDTKVKGAEEYTSVGHATSVIGQKEATLTAMSNHVSELEKLLETKREQVAEDAEAVLLKYGGVEDEAPKPKPKPAADVEDARVAKAAPKPMRKKTRKIESKTGAIKDEPAPKKEPEKVDADVEVAPLVKMKQHRRTRSRGKKAPGPPPKKEGKAAPGPPPGGPKTAPPPPKDKKEKKKKPKDTGNLDRKDSMMSPSSGLVGDSSAPFLNTTAL